jgi:hypothetical protein
MPGSIRCKAPLQEHLLNEVAGVRRAAMAGPPHCGREMPKIAAAGYTNVGTMCQPLTLLLTESGSRMLDRLYCVNIALQPQETKLLVDGIECQN